MFPAGLPLVLRTLLHLGSLHGYEKALVALIAFGPFLVLFVLVYVVRRRDAREDTEPGGRPDSD